MKRRSSPAGFLLVALMLGWLSLPDAALAQASREGNTFAASAAGGIRRFPTVAYDSTNDVYLFASGLGNITCGFITPEGVPTGAPVGINNVGANVYNQAPGAAYSPQANAFLVAWVDTRTYGSQGTVWGRIVSYNGGAVAAVSPEFRVSNATAGGPGTSGANGESRIAVAYSSVSREFIVAWMQYGSSAGTVYDVRAQRVAPDGQLVGPEILVSNDNHWQNQPTIAYNPLDDEYAIAFIHSNFTTGVNSLLVRRIKAGTGALLGGILNVTNAAWVSVPEIRFNTVAGNFLLGWYQEGGFRAQNGLRLSRQLAAIGSIFPIAINFASNDAFGLDYNPVANAFFAIYHGTGVEDVGNEISDAGVPGAPFTVTNTAAFGTNGAFNPKVAASTKRAQWLVVTARSQTQVMGQRVSTATRNGGGPPPPPTETSATIELAATAVPNPSWFFAEGATGSSALGFDTYYLIANEGDTPAEIRTYIAREDGFAYEKLFSVGPRSRHTMRLADHVAPGSYSVVIQSLGAGEPIWAERSMYWGPQFEGGSVSGGVKTLSRQWLFAEGSTKSNNFFDNFLLLFNPHNVQASVDVTYYRPAGHAPTVKTYTIPKQGRLTIHANTINELVNTDFSVKIESDQLITAERSMYWGQNWVGGTNTYGATAGAPVWYFAEGAAAERFDTYYTVLNPNASAITLSVKYLLESGAPVSRSYPIAANSRYTIWLNGEVGQAGAVGAELRTSGGESVVAERSIFWGAPWVEGTNSVGETTTGPTWHLPEGTTKDGFETYVLVANPNTFPVTARMTQLREDSLTVITDITIGAGARRTLYLNDAQQYPSLQNQSFATRVDVLTMNGAAAAGVLVEHAIYWRRDAQNYWRGGSSAFGVR